MDTTKKATRDRRLLTFEEACEYLNMTDHWLRRRVYRNEIKYAKLGGFLRFDPEWLEEYIDANTHDPVDEFDFADDA